MGVKVRTEPQALHQASWSCGELKGAWPRQTRQEEEPARPVVSFPPPQPPSRHLLAELVGGRAALCRPEQSGASGSSRQAGWYHFHLTSKGKRLRARGIKPCLRLLADLSLKTRSAVCPRALPTHNLHWVREENWRWGVHHEDHHKHTQVRR